MGGKLLAEIEQSRPFRSLEQEAFLNLQRTADALMAEIAGVLKPLELSPTQYNVLRILRGAGDGGLPCGRVADRMITREPDMTRLLDRLEKRGLISRCRETSDRRVVCTRITGDGLKVLADLDEPITAANLRLLGHLGQEKLERLIDLLEEVRHPAT